ncbi:MAG: AAA family ATPase [Janthinobacterium lividum]
MIPIRLELKNFMSYGSDVPAIDFSGMHTLCLSGENGHGKSALLDAITWSLWGESRAGKNKHDELVRIGADEMSVHFTFEMTGQRYRVVRKRSKKAGGNLWQLQGETPDQGLGIGWHPLTGNTDRETEVAVQKLLRMSYDTFLNSAYLRQGQADQFVKQTPGKRKEILADILDLSRYDQLEAKARERSKAAGAEATDLERDISGIDAELSAEPELLRQLAELRTRQEQLQIRRDELHLEWVAIKERQTQMKSQAEFAATLTAQIAEWDKEVREVSEELAGHKASADTARALLLRRDEISRNYENLAVARVRFTELERDLEQYYRGTQLLAAADKELMAAENEVQRRLERAVSDHEQASAKVKDYEALTVQRELLAPRVAAADRSEAQIGPLRDALAGWQEQFSSLREQSAGLDYEARDWKRKSDALASQQGQCDVCASDLPPTKVASIQADYQNALALAQAKQKEIKTEAARLKVEIGKCENELRALETQTKSAKDDRTRLAQIEQLLLEQEATRVTLPNLLSVRKEAEQVYSEANFALEVRAKIAKFEAALAKLAHVEADYAAVKAELAVLEPSERLHIQLEHAQVSLKAAEAGIERGEKTLQTRLSNQEVARKQLLALANVGPELAKLEQQGQQIRDQENARRAEDQAASQEIGRREQTLSRLEEQKIVRLDKAKRLTDAKYDQEVHEQLTRAFGKKGVQALIIENAIPELADETNRLLDRLTDGDMSLYFETVKESKSKKDSPIETLDIKVSDNLGTRPLEMYSGGEGFRAAFALRIALSKLLAHRAGASLQTLIIDEGFGSQDAKGREKLVECLHAIQDDFKRIIVITHIDEMKDAFANRIEVTKTASGSHVAMMEGDAG